MVAYRHAHMVYVTETKASRTCHTPFQSPRCASGAVSITVGAAASGVYMHGPGGLLSHARCFAFIFARHSVASLVQPSSSNRAVPT